MKRMGVVHAIVSNLVVVKIKDSVIQYEICGIHIQESGPEPVILMGEVIKVQGENAYVQVFESTRGLAVGAEVEFMGHMLEVQLGPGLLSKSMDGLQNDLYQFDGFFLKRGARSSPIDNTCAYLFRPLMKAGDSARAGDWLGVVRENWLDHYIMAPFDLPSGYRVQSIAAEAEYTPRDEIAVLEGPDGTTRSVTMVQTWPVKIPIRAFENKPRPYKLMETGVRVIDTLNPMAEGGTGFIPGPFGCGKTVLQHIISQHAAADLIIMAACGERANEVVELFKEFPELEDPRTGRKLMERTIIICNTSNMPVASREASVYTAMTIAEYYRQMGLRVLLLADSTSRWAQALREISNRMEELPGPDAYPMDLTAIISGFYARAGTVVLRNGQSGAITFIGTVSPAGGNLKEPVTEATRKSARCFFGLAQHRADAKRYPSVDPIDSYSKYIEYEEVQKYMAEHVDPSWVGNIYETKNRLLRGKEVKDQINILGDDGVPLEYHDVFWKSEVIDFVILQQDAFDPVDKATPIDRQRYMLNFVLGICRSEFKFDHFEDVRDFYKKVINFGKQMNYAPFESSEFHGFQKELEAFMDKRRIQS